MRKRNQKSEGAKKSKSAQLNAVANLSTEDILKLSSKNGQVREMLVGVISAANNAVLGEHLPQFGVSADSEDFAAIHRYGIMGTSSVMSKLSGMPGLGSMVGLAGGGNPLALTPVVDTINDITPGVIKVVADKGYDISEQGVIQLLAFSIIGGTDALRLALPKTLRVEKKRIWVKKPNIMSYMPEAQKVLKSMSK